MTLLPTETGRAVVAYVKTARTFWNTLQATENCDEEGIPLWDTPAVEKAREQLRKVADVLHGLDFPVCNDCTLIDCVCP